MATFPYKIHLPLPLEKQNGGWLNFSNVRTRLAEFFKREDDRVRSPGSRPQPAAASRASPPPPRCPAAPPLVRPGPGLPGPRRRPLQAAAGRAGGRNPSRAATVSEPEPQPPPERRGTPESVPNALLAARRVPAPAGAAAPPAHPGSGRARARLGPLLVLSARTGLHSGAAPAAAAGAAAADRGALQVVPGEAAAVPGQDVLQVHLHPAARRGGDDKAPVTDTNIPSHLDQMLGILLQEEREREFGVTGPCMEYLLHHKILETLYTLGKADCPPGMRQQVLVFYTKLLGRIQQPLLPHINVHRPVQKLIRLCGEVLATPTENEEIQFLCIVCAKLKQNPYLVNFFLENKLKSLASKGTPDVISEDTSKGQGQDSLSTDTGQSCQPEELSGATGLEHTELDDEPPHQLDDLSTSLDNLTVTSLPEATVIRPNQDYNLVNSLLNLTRSPDGRIAVKACEGLMLLVSLPEPAAARCLTQSTCLCELLTDRLASLYKALPQSVDPLDIETVEAINWGLDSYSHKEDASAFPGKRALISFLSWFDYCDQLIKEAQKTAAVALAKAVHERFFIGIMEPQLMQTSEMGILTSTALLHRIVRQVTSDVLLQEMVFFILGEQREPETLAEISRHPLRHRLIEHCDHISDEISIMTLRMFEHLLQKPNEHILYNLVLRNLEERNYTEYKPVCPEDKDVVENGLIAGAVDLEEDPLFTDISPDNTLSNQEWLSSSPPATPDHPKNDGKTEVHKIVNSFLCLVPDEAKSSYHVEGTGYDTYLRDAHRQFRDYCAICLRWEWPGSPKALEKCNLEATFFEGHFLKVLFDRMGRILDQPYDVNLQVTSVLSRLSLFPHPHIHEYLLDPYVNLASGCRSLFSVIVRVVGDLMVRIQRIQDFTPKLLLVRKRLLGLEPEGPIIDHITLLEGVIVLEEFCKELAAIAFVKYHASSTP
ncbi:FHF complex subunit HOOK interacting protein 2A isoform X1 [Panthera uncia]|uniref:FHF complex subunit HOOK interacting protein 2A isoform X1 n=1 Tax=Panthera uncia TaxID=29064 RepID=UPI0020FFA648|nr:FHF complex subunit HOOK interacting protein 2A isoform X1 [Panthera uncia]